MTLVVTGDLRRYLVVPLRSRSDRYVDIIL